MEKVYVVTDLGPGDGGKGTIVHALAHKLKPKIIIKRGGAQGSHGVRTSRGDKFNFSQWGCGTFDAVPTFLSDQMVIMPVGLENEAEALRKTGIYDPYAFLEVDARCICATPYHKIDSQLDELLRKDHPRGTIGTGVGKAYRMMMELGASMTVQAFELKDRRSRKIARKLQAQANYYREKYADISVDDCLLDDTELIAENLELLYDDGFLTYTIGLFEEVGRKLRLGFLEDILELPGTAIVESSHGVLTDSEDDWMYPHVSGIGTLPEYTEEMLGISGYTGEVYHLGVHRSYEIRHGAGPMPTYDPEFTKQMLPDSHKQTNRWQGAVRAGALDLNLLKHALDSCDKAWPWDGFDGICLTWFDQLFEPEQIRWPICTGYENTEMRIGETRAEWLERAVPIVEQYTLKTPVTEEELFDFAQKTLGKFISVPLKVISCGPTELDKIGLENI